MFFLSSSTWFDLNIYLNHLEFLNGSISYADQTCWQFGAHDLFLKVTYLPCRLKKVEFCLETFYKERE